MKIIKYVKVKTNKYQIFLDNGEILETYDDIILEKELLYKKELDIVTYNQIIEENNILENYYICIKYIKFRIRSKKEIIDYMLKKKINPNIIEKVLDKLIKNKYIDDDYYCKCFINDKLKLTSYGEYKIINELKKASIDEHIINKYYYMFDKSLLQDKMNKLIDKYIKTNKKYKGLILKNKIYTNLMNQGYSKDMIASTLNNCYFDE